MMIAATKVNLKPGKLLVDGQWADGVKTFDTLDPASRWINTYGLMDASHPFGGYKSSGFGGELVAHVMEHYTELKTVWLNLA